MNYLEVANLPRYDYQLTGKVYKYLCDIAKSIANELKKVDFEDITLLSVDYFVWDELQVEDNLNKISVKRTREGIKKEKEIELPEQMIFIHDDIRDKIKDIGLWLGFNANKV